VLGASLIPTALAAHRFGESKTSMPKERDTMGFVKNAAILGGSAAQQGSSGLAG
jgi:hypothetical protein